MKLSKEEWKEAGRMIVAYHKRIKATGGEFFDFNPKKPVGIRTSIMAKRHVTSKHVRDFIGSCAPDIHFSYREAKRYLEWSKGVRLQ